MGRSKPFIDKKQATTYRLLYNAEETGQVESTHASAGGCLPDNPFNTLCQDEYPSSGLTEERRREIVELGLPDDGYDYFKHIKNNRGVDAGDASTASDVEGPWYFQPAPFLQPPPEDVKVIDARSLPCQPSASEQDDIVDVLGRVTAFSREMEEGQPIRRNEVAAVDEILEALGREDDVGNADGDGDLLDDFVLTAAAKAPSVGSGAAADREQHVNSADDSTESGSSCEDDDTEGERSRMGQAYVGSIASTYWRPERTNRGALSAIDERFENLALEYDSDELGDLEEVEGGTGTLEQYASVLEQCLAEQGTTIPMTGDTHQEHETALPTNLGSKGSSNLDDDARTAIKKARELLEASLLDEGPPVSAEQSGIHNDAFARTWDCESILTSHSTCDNLPRMLGDGTPSRGCNQDCADGARRARHADSIGWHAKDKQDESDQDRQPGTCSIKVLQRSKDESKEEKKERKQQVKSARREARASKKELRALQQGRAGCRTGSSMEQHRQRIVPFSP